mgnify:FL=1
MTQDNPLRTEKISKLILRFAVPSIIAMLIIACYNIVDQLFIGNVIGPLGNAATNIVFPMTNACLALGLCFGTGGASAFNLKQGEGDSDSAAYYFGNAVASLLLSGIILAVVIEIFMNPMLRMFGAPDTVMPYAREYARILAIGLPFTILGSGAGHLLRADGRPNLTMACNLTGCIINIGLDAWFIVGLGWGMKGAALATIIGQVASGILCIFFLTRCRTFRLQLKHLIPKLQYFGRDFKLGLASLLNQLTLMVVQIIMNNILNYQGAQSVYGSEIPIAAAGIIMKVSSIFSSVVIGLSQGNQPIASYNYGAQNYRRVKESFLRVLMYGGAISLVAFAVFQLFPAQILELFGKGNELYIEFGSLYFRRYLFMVWLFFVQPITSNSFTAIGKPYKGIFLSLTRQVIYFIPIVLIFSNLWGIEGVMFAQPAADVLSILTTFLMIGIESRTPQFRDEKGVLREILFGSR